MTLLKESLNQIELDEFGLNRILINLILQIFIKNEITDPNDIINTIIQYLDIECNNPIIYLIANKLNIFNQSGNWIWVE